MPNAKPDKEELPTTRPGTPTDPRMPREIESPGDPGPTVLVPPEMPALPVEPPRQT